MVAWARALSKNLEAGSPQSSTAHESRNITSHFLWQHRPVINQSGLAKGKMRLNQKVKCTDSITYWVLYTPSYDEATAQVCLETLKRRYLTSSFAEITTVLSGIGAGGEHAAMLTHTLISVHPHASSQVCTELTVSHAFIHTHISLRNLTLTHLFSSTAAVEAHIPNTIMSTCTQPSLHMWPSPDLREEGPMWTHQPCPTRAGQCGAALAAGREAGHSSSSTGTQGHRPWGKGSC